MIRVALYARYSSDQQSSASIADQQRICRERALRETGMWPRYTRTLRSPARA